MHIVDYLGWGGLRSNVCSTNNTLAPNVTVMFGKSTYMSFYVYIYVHSYRLKKGNIYFRNDTHTYLFKFNFSFLHAVQKKTSIMYACTINLFLLIHPSKLTI